MDWQRALNDVKLQISVSQVFNYSFGPVWAANCEGFIQLIDGNPRDAISDLQEALSAVSNVLGGTRPHLVTATVLHNLGLATYLSDGLSPALTYFRR